MGGRLSNKGAIIFYREGWAVCFPMKLNDEQLSALLVRRPPIVNMTPTKVTNSLIVSLSLSCLCNTGFSIHASNKPTLESVRISKIAATHPTILLDTEIYSYTYRILKRHRMRQPGSDGNLNVMFFKKIQIILSILSENLKKKT